MSINNVEGMRLNMIVHKTRGGKQNVSVGQRKSFMKWKVQTKCKKQEDE
jgi:hypothetical protein